MEKINLAIGSPYFIEDHKVQDMIVVPGAIFVDLAVKSVKEGAVISIHNIKFNNAKIISETETDTEIKVLIKDATSTSRNLEFASCSEGNSDGTSHAAMTVKLGSKNSKYESQELSNKFNDVPSNALDASDYYRNLGRNGNGYGGHYRTIVSLVENESIIAGELNHASEFDADFGVNPFLLDGCIQALAVPIQQGNRAYVLEEIGSIVFHEKAGTECHVRIKKSSVKQDQDVVTGDIQLLNSDGALAWELSNVRLKILNEEKNTEKSVLPLKNVAVAATFTSEPIEGTLQYWLEMQGYSANIAFAPYNQVFQQLLTPDSIINNSDLDYSVILLRLEDWVRKERNLKLQVSVDQKKSILAPFSTFKLDNHVDIAHLNKYETEYVYSEIFRDNAYLKHGITIEDGDCIVDIGANIGLFTLFAHTRAKNISIYAFEPSPPVFELLSANVRLYAPDTHVFNVGVSDKKREAEFTFYKKSSVFSTFSADKTADETAIRAVVENMLTNSNALDPDQVEKLIDELMEDRLTSTDYTCQLISLSDIISDNNIKVIDLLKLDAEKSELPVLKGISEADWLKIKQIVVEVHDKDGPVIDEVTAILESRGFSCHIEEEEFLQNSGLYNIFAVRPEVASSKNQESLINDFADSLGSTVNHFLSALDSREDSTSCHTYISVCPPSKELSSDQSKLQVVNGMEREIEKHISAMSTTHFLSVSQVAALYPVQNILDADSDVIGKIPYTLEYFCALGTAISRRASEIERRTYKVIVLDCDNTLWKGVCGEDGVDGIDISEPFVYLQQFMIAKMQAGMILCLCSKNMEEDVWAVFDNREEMQLSRSDIVASRINWDSKSKNISDLAEELNLGLDSFIFLDDNPIECAEVSANCHQVLTLQLPTDDGSIKSMLDSVWAFDRTSSTAEDVLRTSRYQENIQREQYRKSTITLENFLSDLELVIHLRPMQEENIQRVSQLTFRTNQFNANGIRRSEGEIRSLLENEKSACLVTDVEDRFGAYGLVGVLIYEITESVLRINTLLLSCRVLGRGVEHEMLASAGKIALQANLDHVEVDFVSTGKNKPVLNFLNSLVDDGAAVSDISNSETRSTFRIQASIASEITYKAQENKAYAESAIKYSSSRESLKSEGENDTRPIDKINQVAIKHLDVDSILADIKTHYGSRNQPIVGSKFVEPSSKLEKELSEVWCQVLDRDRIGINDNFFEIGGTSLKGVHLISKLSQGLSVDLGIVDLFAAPTVKAMTDLIEARRTGGAEDSSKIESSESRGSKRRDMQRRRRKS